ncbi:DNA/RNA-binding protein KIN17-like [Ornithodoros turicata]|uniref:DNA/RNA-binding protein KIN17-like n=1 Tax=Ornithodoros turicata TaxID=34597 RepID=UPI00313913BD
MPKHEAGTPKAIANRIKSKGLQKLRWFCQMCQKQCRDENGFKCHTMSESHQRQLLLFAECPGKYLGSFSSEFAQSFLELLKRRFGTKRVHANQVYQEYIADKNHLHMNATRWLTLTSFVKWLGREGHCTVDETEKGWFITYVDRDPETIRRQEAVAKKERLDLDDQERMSRFIEKQIERDRERLGGPSQDVGYTELKREDEEEKVVFKLPLSSKPKEATIKQETIKRNWDETTEEPRKKRSQESSSHKSALEEIMQEQEKTREKRNRKDYWLCPGIVVKVIAKKIGEKYYKKKGVVQEVQDKYVAVVHMLDSRDVLRLDQAHLETVIPNLGRRVKVVNGAYRGEEAVLLEIQADKFSAKLSIDAGPMRGRVIQDIEYKDFSKLHEGS